MAWERPQADKRWDDLAVAHIDEIAKGLRPREFEKKLVELLDPTLMQAPPSASDRREEEGRGAGRRGPEARPRAASRCARASCEEIASV